MEHNPFDSFYPDDEHMTGDSEDSKESKKKKKRSLFDTEAESSDKKQEKTETDDGQTGAKERRPDLSSLFEINKVDKPKTDAEHSERLGDETEITQNPEELSEEELRLITRQIIDDRDKELEGELASVEPDSSEETEVLSSALFVESLAEEVDKGKSIDDELLDAVVGEVARDLDIASADHEPTEESTAEPDEEGSDDDDSSLSFPAASSTGKPTVSRSTTVAPSISPVLPIPPAPPRPPVPPSGGGPSGSPSAPSGTNPNTSFSRPVVIEKSGNRHQRGADLLVGGIVGYLIGRRRGRIKTEARLLPIQKSLEKQVRDLHEKIAIREKTVRSLTAEKIAREGENMRRVVAEKVEARARAKSEMKQLSVERSGLRPVSTEEQLATTHSEAVRLERQEAPAYVHRHEKLAGAVISQIETRPAVTKEAVNRMSEVELLKMAAIIEVDGQSAKQLYEQGRINKEDLRAVVTEQLIGQGKAERILRERRQPIESDAGTHERLTGQQNASQATPQPLPVSASTQDIRSDKRQKVDVSAASDALIAQYAAREHEAGSHAYTYLWIIVGIVVALFILSLFLF